MRQDMVEYYRRLSKENDGIVVLSLFDGMSCGQIALERAGIKVKKYYASEIKKSAIFLTQHHFPETVHIGDVTRVNYENGWLSTEVGRFYVGHIDLLLAGSPCQDFSILNVLCIQKGKEIKGLEGNKSRLFYEFLRLKIQSEPRFWLLENVKMKKQSEVELNEYLGEKGIPIDSKLLTFQTRARLYWTNIPGVTKPHDRHVSFQDFKDTDFDYCNQFKVKRTPSRERMWNEGKGRTSVGACKNVTSADKVGCLTRKQDRAPNSGLVEHGDFCRYLTRRELELAQTVEEGYTDPVSYNQAQDLLGDGWTVDVIVHIFKQLKEELQR